MTIKKNKTKKRKDELRDKLIEYRSASIITFNSVLIIISTMCLCSPKIITLFENSCFFITIIAILFEHRYIDKWYIKYENRKKFYGGLLKFTKHIAFISFTIGVYSVIFII